MQKAQQILTKIVFLICALAIAGLNINAAKLTIKIDDYVDDATPIAVTPFSYQGINPNPFDFAELISSDLGSTGEFIPMQRKDMVVDAEQSALFNYADWKLLGADVVITGQVVETTAGSYTITMSAFDTIRTKPILAYEIPANSRNLRPTAHHLSDVLYEKLTGVKGIFSTRIAYINVTGAWNNKSYELIVADVDGENQAVVARSRAPLMSPAWSPDARQLAYVSFENGHSEIYVQNLSTGKRNLISSRPGINSAPAYSPDGKYMAMTLSQGSGNLDIYIMEIASGKLKRLTESRAIDTEANWSDDGESLYFTSDRAGQPQIYRISKNGGKTTRVSFVGNYNARPRVSADTKHLAVVHADGGAYQIGLVNRSNGQIFTLTDGTLDEAPSVSPNGRVVIYATQRNGQGVLATVSADGRSKPAYLAAIGDVREPAWSPFR
ncbi:MAG: Tol-Pal system beta propeller repeat protein TolB [Gammaproteobacteria bacterium]|nr:Tol-Pal system beta propeller repeat protein TolB [Gammaproteobacteria bacterium]NNC97169.1 Tol-Pal system beta propeller repeat protein TolB [Gammaproteobacteria bacterium]NNM13638.1 Tol-Pal system beta propeller repeat protein TolB [Gammaproteobacteria bacterium]